MNYLLFDFYGSTHEKVETVLQGHKEIRNYHGQIPDGGGYYALADVLAQALNSSVIGTGHPSYEEGRHPKWFPAVNEFDAKVRTFGYIWDRYFHGNSSNLTRTSNGFENEKPEMPHFVRLDAMNLNFAICEIPKRKWDSATWDFTVFTDFVDKWTWISLVLTLFFVSILSFSNFRQKFNFNPAFFAALSVLLSEEVSGGAPRKFGNSFLFLLWMFLCLILVPFYSGDIASQVIIPSPFDKVSSIDNLDKLNYTVIYGDQITQNFYSDVSNLVDRPFIPPNIKILERLFKRAASRPYLDGSFYRSMVTEPKVAPIMNWNYAISCMNRAYLWMGEFPAQSKGIKCYIGGELIKLGERFHIFLPPDAKKTEKAFQHLRSYGFAQRWSYEFDAATFGFRVQERVRFKSEKNVEDVRESKLTKLKMKGRTVTVFVMWGGLLCISLGCLLLEKIMRKSKPKKSGAIVVLKTEPEP